jgi:hypothetical protein
MRCRTWGKMPGNLKDQIDSQLGLRTFPARRPRRPKQGVTSSPWVSFTVAGKSPLQRELAIVLQIRRMKILLPREGHTVRVEFSSKVIWPGSPPQHRISTRPVIRGPVGVFLLWRKTGPLHNAARRAVTRQIFEHTRAAGNNLRKCYHPTQTVSLVV